VNAAAWSETFFKAEGDLFRVHERGVLLRASGLYDCDLCHDGDSWKIRRLRTNPSWVERGPVDVEFLGARAHT
jgi:hypothetical protein